MNFSKFSRVTVSKGKRTMDMLIKLVTDFVDAGSEGRVAVVRNLRTNQLLVLKEQDVLESWELTGLGIASAALNASEARQFRESAYLLGYLRECKDWRVQMLRAIKSAAVTPFGEVQTNYGADDRKDGQSVVSGHRRPLPPITDMNYGDE